MLVISRRLQQRILFPGLEVAIQILRVHGQVVRLGIDAPGSIQVMREELLEGSPGRTRPGFSAGSSLSHAVRNRLNRIGLSLHLLSRQCRAGAAVDTQAALDSILDEFEALQEECEQPRASAVSDSALRCSTMVVEDDRNERELLAGLLSMNGIDVTQAGDGVEALELLERCPQPDVVLLDLGLPRCDGMQTLRAIRRDERHSQLKVFAVCGEAPEMGCLDDDVRGFDGWFRKPLNPRKLLGAIRSLVLPAP